MSHEPGEVTRSPMMGPVIETKMYMPYASLLTAIGRKEMLEGKVMRTEWFNGIGWEVGGSLWPTA